MLRIVSTLTIMLLLAAGCSKKEVEDTGAQPAGESGQVAKRSGEKDRDSQPKKNATAVESDAKPAAVDDASSAPPDAKAGNGMVDPEARANVMTLLEQMGSDAAVERRAASDQLDRLGEAGFSYIVIGLREGTVVQQRGAATYLIGRVSPRDQDAAKALISALKADDAALRRAALQAVEKLEVEQLTTALPELLTFAGNGSVPEGYRSRAIRAITKPGLQATAAVDEVTRLALEDPSLSVRRACYSAVAKIAPQEQAESFYCERLTSEKQPDLRRLAAKWLAGVAKSDQSLAILVTAMQDPDEAVRLQAVDALVELGKPALPSLIKALDSPEVQTRRHAALAIGKMGLLAVDAKSALEARLDDPDEQVRELSKAALQILK